MWSMISSNGAFFVVALGHELWVYWARGSHHAQLFCWKLVKIQRYCSSHWFVHSNCPSVWGWYAVLMFWSICRSLQSSFVKVAMR